ncbi:MAG TPA: damage-inducible protein DinB [Cyanobacteria bacterium UBA12227]|nr:damage-inducible protein DinB [Cyanobacteria bacterium UBA12227]HAX88947.1 damage-inducible protein DinB [Cyanobacteria bacterium UBA11370]HBY80062.1 damage-inducible protein DinB [Cyanobacteria bacterium UBA11148]
MKTTDYFQRLSQYNHWMNERLYEVCDSIPDAIRKEDRGAFFGSIHGTLNHILLADKLWLGRFKHQLFEVHSLNQELYADFKSLHQERQKTDQEIQAWVDSLTDEQLAAPFRFTSIAKAREFVFPLWHIAAHFFNHQTHHRGQLTTLLTQSGYDPGVTDLLLLPGTEIEE